MLINYFLEVTKPFEFLWASG